jgi:soluble lytic murein transglycosylase-like protein
MIRNPWSRLTRHDGQPPRWYAWATGAGALVGGIALVGTLAAALAGLTFGQRPSVPAATVVQAEVVELQRELDLTNAKLAQAQVQLERLNAVARYSSLYSVPADLAGAIYDIARAEGIHPSLGFQLVKVESSFKRGARSNKGAIGYTQLRLKTARFYDAEATERSLHDRDTNLRIGFRFLKDLLAQFDEDLNMALLAYNRGPQRVVDMLARGEDPANGYAEIVMRGLKKGL